MFDKGRYIAMSSVLILLMSGAFPNASLAEEDEPTADLYGEHDFSSSDDATVIVELEEESVAEANHEGFTQSEDTIETQQTQVLSEIETFAGDYEVGHTYSHVFSGFSIDVPEDEIPNLLTVDGVEAVYPYVEYETTDIGEPLMIQEDEMDPQMLDSGPFIGADEAWDLGYTGEGSTVAVIDTGVDYTHPDLEHAFGDYKGYDFVDDTDDPQETPPGDPRGTETNHGTHVAGTVAADGLTVGIAPDADLLAYRVLGPGGTGSNVDVIAGIEQAVIDDADVMNLSLGNTLNDPDYATSIALDWAMEEGVAAVTSNGNAGPDNWTVGSPGTSRDAISVGASELPYSEYSAEIETEQNEYPSAAVMGYPNELDLLALDEEEFEFVDVGQGHPEDFEGEDLEDKIALMIRGDIPFVEKVENAEEAGAVGTIIFNNVEGEQPLVPGLPLPTMMLSLEDGQQMQSALAQGDDTVSFDLAFEREVDETIAEFSSRGPVMDTWMIKPDVAAPGVDIISTIPTHEEDDPHGYASLQGTSMAAPHVAGAAAVLMESDPDADVEELKGLLMNTSETLQDPESDIYPYNTQGAGSIRVPDAIESNTAVTPGSHSFGVFAEDDGVQSERSSYTIHNRSDERQPYAFDIEFAGNPDGIDVLTSSDVALNPGESEEIRANIQVDPSLLDEDYYEGTITIDSMEETIEVPTILFVDEPDYPRITELGVAENDEGDFDYTAYLPGGAEEFGLWVYQAEPFEYVGLTDVETDVPEGEFTGTWDGTIDGDSIPGGDYVLVGYANHEGQVDYAQSPVISLEATTSATQQLIETSVADDEAAHALSLHMTALTHYEDQGDSDKFINHMGGFHDLLDQQLDSELISENTFNVLSTQADLLIEQWQ
ncbi:S8 family serine peptidase [Natribacillus halophilus]|uniref:Minor extracellular serine protease Vpr n=1 Tax=Natribacillus halophilus TaxID=549003 RepID=A0A1G8LQ62_9BACI|nr:S8 family serine peptidase [Natribacillus halophilus]SDI57842.1 minor extracellular serine protease Vpr [Natribacillus halophilus]